MAANALGRPRCPESDGTDTKSFVDRNHAISAEVMRERENGRGKEEGGGLEVKNLNRTSQTADVLERAARF